MRNAPESKIPRGDEEDLRAAAGFVKVARRDVLSKDLLLTPRVAVGCRAQAGSVSGRLADPPQSPNQTYTDV